MILLAQVVRVSVIFTPCCTCAVLSDLFDLPFYFHLSFSVFFHSSVLMHLTCTPTSTTWTPWKMTCATPPRGASTPTTSPTPSHLLTLRSRSPCASWAPTRWGFVWEGPLAFSTLHHSAREGCPSHCGTLTEPGGNSGLQDALRHEIDWHESFRHLRDEMS